MPSCTFTWGSRSRRAPDVTERSLSLGPAARFVEPPQRAVATVPLVRDDAGRLVVLGTGMPLD